MLTDENKLEEELSGKSKEKKSPSLKNAFKTVKRNREGSQITIDKIISKDLKNDAIDNSNAEISSELAEGPDYWECIPWTAAANEAVL